MWKTSNDTFYKCYFNLIVACSNSKYLKKKLNKKLIKDEKHKTLKLMKYYTVDDKIKNFLIFILVHMQTKDKCYHIHVEKGWNNFKWRLLKPNSLHETRKYREIYRETHRHMTIFTTNNSFFVQFIFPNQQLYMFESEILCSIPIPIIDKL